MNDLLEILNNPELAISEIEDLINKLNVLLTDLKKKPASDFQATDGIGDVVKVHVIRGGKN